MATESDNSKQKLTQQDDPYEKAKKQALALLDQGFHLGGGIRVLREELHERGNLKRRERDSF